MTARRNGDRGRANLGGEKDQNHLQIEKKELGPTQMKDDLQSGGFGGLEVK